MIEKTCQDCQQRPVKPSFGSWITYCLGTENQNLPGFIALAPGGGGAENLRSAFLPGAYQGTAVNTSDTRIDRLIENINNKYVSLPEQRKQLDLLHQLNEVHAQNLKKDGQLDARLLAYELAYQMQMEATYELGYRAVEKKVHIHDLHATVLHLVVFNHEKLTCRYNGRDFRLTEVYGNMVKQLLS